MASGALLFSLREVLQNGSTVVLKRHEYAHAREEEEIGEDAPPPTSQQRKRGTTA